MNAHTYNAPTISAGTIARTACLLLALTNQVLSALGKPVLPIESQTVEQLVTAGITTVEAVAAYAESLMPDWGGVGRYPVKAGRTKGWVHVDTRPNKSRWTQ